MRTRLIHDVVEETLSFASRLAAFETLCERCAHDADDRAAVHPQVLVGLQSFGILTAPLSREVGGEGLLAPERWPHLFDMLRRIGSADLSIGRLFEGHANAIELISRYGTSEQLSKLGGAIRNGAMTGVWGADGRTPLQIRKLTRGWLLEGGKILASGAGLLARPVVSAGSEDGQRLVLLELQGNERIDLAAWTPLGMRSSATGSVDFTGVVVPNTCLVGSPGDFTRQPYFSGGAWRFCAVHLGGMERLVDLYRQHLRERQRGEDPYQLERIAACISAVGTASNWIRAAARQLATRPDEPERSVALSNFARVITERAALDILEAVQRGVGLTAFVRPNPIERVARDLATYLRQPVPDLAMADAARFALANQAPVRELWGPNADQ